jgi:hypothetical protein
MAGWVSVSDELPESDTLVLVRHEDATDTHEYELALLEFTDDSEGNGKPYWSMRDARELRLEDYPCWMYPSPPKETP